MGTDCNLYLRSEISPDMIGTALMRARGLPLESDNPYEGRKLWEASEVSTGFYTSTEGWPYLFLNTNGPTGPCTMLSARSRPEVIAAFTAVAKAFGGFLVWQDSSDEGVAFLPHEPENETWIALDERTKAIKAVEPNAADHKSAAYKESRLAQARPDHEGGRE